jgi:hypothetical protein
MLSVVGRLAAYLALPALGAIFASACNPTTRDLLVDHPYDAGDDAFDAASGADAEPDANPDLGGPCTDDAQCDENIPCEYFKCDLTLGRCFYTPDSSQCQDGIYCDGQEQCVLHHGCEPGPIVTCDNGDPCMIDHCDEATMSCVSVPRDADQDGDPDAHCVPHHDCNDMDPNVSSLHAEVCANHIDDNCNGLIDEMPCVVVQGDDCSSAIPIDGPGAYELSTVGADRNFATSCTVSTPAGSQNIVAAVTVPNGPNVDLDVWATTPATEVALAVDATCGQPSSELSCESAPMATAMRTRARNVPPGTYYVIVTTQAATTVELQIDFLTPTPKATNENCATALPIALNTATTVSIIDPDTELVSACTAETGELTYAFTLTTASDVRVFASTLVGSGEPVIGLRDPECTAPSDELSCHVGPTPPLFVRDLAPATYVITVAGTSPIDASILVETYAPTTPPADESCTSPPPITPNVETDVDLTNNEEGAIPDGCFPGGPNGAFDLPLAVASDVLLVGRFPQNETGAVSLDDTTCTAAGELACSTAVDTPARVGRRNVPAGDYRAVLTDAYGESDTLMPLVRATVPPVAVTGPVTCGSSAVTIPSSGGFFTGDTSTSQPFYEEGCDAPNQPAGGAPDQTLSLTLTQPQRVIFDMEGSVYQTLLAIYQGPACPGTQVTGACYVGFTAARSFLDLELAAGQYWVVVDGYSGAKGAWDLDVRVVAP